MTNSQNQWGNKVWENRQEPMETQQREHGGQSVAAATGMYATATAYGCQWTQLSLGSIATADGFQAIKL